MSIPIDEIICGDNCDVLGTLPRACIDLVVTSPPYDDLRTYGGHSWDFYGVAWQLKRVLKPGGVIVWVVADQTKGGSETLTSGRQSWHFVNLGLNMHDTMIWKKDVLIGGGDTGSRYLNCWEYMFILSKGKPKTTNLISDRPNEWAGGIKRNRFDRRIEIGNASSGKTERTTAYECKELGARTSIWDIAVERGGNDHPAPFPEALARDHILSWSNEGDIVLDPFNGSGTTTKMARELGRRYIGIDVNPDYCEIARKRLAQSLLFGPPERETA
jgi:DNA modification methylase